MLGHKVLQVFSQRFETYGTVRTGAEELRLIAPEAAGLLEGVSAFDFDTVVRAVGSVHPDVVMNCIGIVKQLETAKDPLVSIRVNSLFPHRLGRLCEAAGSRLLHVSTDCVFSGRKGGYTEDDTPDPVDLYGRSKLLGEVSDLPAALTVRTSIVGRELHGAHGLVEWFLTQNGGEARGFRRAIFSGWSTTSLARALAELIETQPDLSGLWHVAASPINKFDLLKLLRDAFELDVTLEADDDFVCDRSLDGSRFRAATGIVAPDWPEMVEEMREDSASYRDLRERSLANR